MQNPFIVLTVYSVAIITMPIAVFFGTKSLVEIVSPTAEGNLWGAVTSVITVHIVLFAFVYKAFQEEKKVAKEAGAKKD